IRRPDEVAVGGAVIIEFGRGVCLEQELVDAGLEPGDGVGAGGAAGDAALVEVEVPDLVCRVVTGAEVDGVGAEAARKAVRSGAAQQGVVAVPAVEDVVAVAAVEQVVAGAAEQVIVAVAAEQGVVAVAAVDGVVAAAAGNRVVAGIGGDAVVAGAAGDVEAARVLGIGGVKGQRLVGVPH